MKGLIPRDFILDLIARTNILDVIGKRVKMKKKGNNYFGCCPFHDEKTASFSLSEKKQIYYCFGCGASGSVVNFLMQYDRLSFPEAIEELASMQGIRVPYTDTDNKQDDQAKHIESRNVRKDLYTLMAKITHFYQQQLALPTSIDAQHYLEQRGLNHEIIARYKIGYAPNEWRLTSQNVVKSNAESTLYNQAGMLVTNDNGNQYDRFRGRIMFPIRDRQGNVIAFGGRTIINDSAKYINSPETPIFHKGFQLYGLYEAQEVNRNPEKLIVVEGYMDVVSLAQYGIDYAVAALGTSTSEEHIKLLFRASDSVIFCYDGDNAGRSAAWRALNVLLPCLIDGKKITFVFLPQDEDPDSFVRKVGKDGFEDYLKTAPTLSEFLFDELLKQVDLKTAEGKAKLSSLAIPLLDQIKAKAFRLNLLQQLGRYLGLLDVTQIEQLMSTSRQKGEDKVTEIAPASQMKLTTMRILIGLLIQYPNLAKQVTDIAVMRQVKLAGIDIFIELLELCQRYPNITTAQILTECINRPFYKQLNRLATFEYHYQDEEVSSIFSHTLKELYDNILTQRQDELIAKERVSGLSTAEKKELATLILVLSKKD
ncbi:MULTISPECIES: DNA primase [unclassified Gilliamella]|uniref:DNA primase n=1 Tax=unclassified Gilliamella TaxID=2685620 RepID=UPI00226987DA|nr:MULTISPECIES: DNA primase [unclassified Gilliamella]MCX8642086.1 DNA primase [Gilliamella sp. B3835]MCX8707272.1 DNA primase [Gilliamella sp. B3783]MCX8710819.1 DNA primase [Gilliamella sp. B3780]MCX8711820.1 DNA primase [Gilliamella sp. B3468]MCX8713987.1 DNA primase [Gilliamella sp. B3781]